MLPTKLKYGDTIHRVILTSVLLCGVGLGQDPDQCPTTNLCLEDYCDKCYFGCTPTTLPPEVVNGSFVKMFQNLDDYCDCCQFGFIPHIGEGERCFITVNSYDLPSKGMCGPQLSCQRDEEDPSLAYCRRKISNCHNEQDEYDRKVTEGILGMDEKRPVCDEDGYYSAVQCFFTGVCRCVDKSTGFPIFGFAVDPETAQEEGMNCECAREAQKLREMSCDMEVDYDGEGQYSKQKFSDEYMSCMLRKTYLFQDHLRCMPNGNYDPAQCIGRVAKGEEDDTTNTSPVCFCLDEELKINGSMVSIEYASNMLECHFEDDTHYNNYYRPCELARKQHEDEQRRMKNEANTLYLENDWIGLCSADGYYDRLQQDPNDSTRGYCSDRLNNRIGEYTGVFNEMNCYCAQVQDGMLPTDDRPRCTEDGSFDPVQCRGERCYCVNEYGKQTTMEEYISVFDPATCYSNL